MSVTVIGTSLVDFTSTSPIGQAPWTVTFTDASVAGRHRYDVGLRRRQHRHRRARWPTRTTRRWQPVHRLAHRDLPGSDRDADDDQDRLHHGQHRAVHGALPQTAIDSTTPRASGRGRPTTSPATWSAGPGAPSGNFIITAQSLTARRRHLRRATSRSAGHERAQVASPLQRPATVGQALVEFALMIPIFLFLIVALFDMGRAVFAYNTLTNAAREGARMAIVNQDKATIVERAKAPDGDRRARRPERQRRLLPDEADDGTADTPTRATSSRWAAWPWCRSRPPTARSRRSSQLVLRQRRDLHRQVRCCRSSTAARTRTSRCPPTARSSHDRSIQPPTQRKGPHDAFPVDQPPPRRAGGARPDHRRRRARDGGHHRRRVPRHGGRQRLCPPAGDAERGRRGRQRRRHRHRRAARGSGAVRRRRQDARWTPWRPPTTWPATGRSTRTSSASC